MLNLAGDKKRYRVLLWGKKWRISASFSPLVPLPMLAPREQIAEAIVAHGWQFSQANGDREVDDDE